MTAGAARIRVTFQVDADGLMSVTALETISGVVADIVVKPSYGLTDGEIETMLRASMEHARDDMALRMQREQQVDAERVIEAIDAALATDAEHLLSAAERALIKAPRDALAQAMKSGNSGELKQLIAALEETSEFYVARRMNNSVQQALAGKQIDEVDV
jgi:molecular chaperone HscA